MRNICILDYNIGNLYSLKNIFEKFDCEVSISKKKKDILKCDLLVLPGVGTFPEVIKFLKFYKIDKVIIKRYHEKKNILGICIGLQIFSNYSDEIKKTIGLKLINFKTIKFEKNISHIGWNKILMKNSLDEYKIHGKYFYFNHSFYLNHTKDEKKNIKYVTKFRVPFPALVKKGSFIGTAFHPEKSQKNGEYFISKVLNYVKT